MSHAEGIQKNHDVLQRCTTINFYVIDYLRAEDVLDEEQEHDLKTERNPLRQRILLYQWLKKVSQDKYESFLQVMIDTEQEHVANLLTGSTKEDHLPLSEARYKRLLKIRHKMPLVTRIDSEVIAELRSLQVVSMTDAEEINAEAADYAKVSRLISAIMRRSNYSFNSFQEVLRKTLQTAAAQFLSKGEMPAVHLNNNRPDLDEPFSLALNDLIRNRTTDDAEIRGLLAEINKLGLSPVKAISGQSIVIFIYCKTILSAVKFTQLYNSGRLHYILEGILNRLLLTIEPHTMEKLESRISLEDDDICNLEEFTGVEGWMTESLHKSKRWDKKLSRDAQTQTGSAGHKPGERRRVTDRLVMFREPRPTYNVPGTSLPMVVNDDSKVSPKRSMPLSGALSLDHQTVLGQKAKDSGRRIAQHKDTLGVSDYDTSSSSLARRASREIRSFADEDFEKSSKPPQQQRVEKKVRPMAKAITRGNSSDRELLVFRDVRKSRTEQDVGSLLDRSSSEFSRLGKVTTTSSLSGSSSSGAGSLALSGRWRERWCIDKVGTEPDQIRCITDLCMLGSGNIVATEPTNSRLQLFTKTGKSLAVLSPDTEDLWSARSFGDPLTFRKMKPMGVVETVVDNLVAVTDLNRVLYIEALSDGMLDGEVVLEGRRELRGITTAWSSKIIVTEVGSQAFVGQYETSGKFIREYKGNFRKPCFVTHDPTYNVTAVSDSEQGLVFLYDTSGNLLTKFGASGYPTGSRSSAGHLVCPAGLCWSRHGRLLVADEAERRVVAFDLRNLTVETVLSAKDGLERPVAIAADFRDSRNRIYVSEEVDDFGVNNYYLKMFEQRPIM